jgi:hypothetical protein
VDYFISRDGQQYGPYTLADLQRYAASGDVSLADLATSEGMAEPVSVAQIIGTIAAAPPVAAGAPISMADLYPDPPNLHWGLVLLFEVLTCGLFSIVWEIVQAVWIRRLQPESKAIYIYCGAAAVLVFVFASGFLHARNPLGANFTGPLRLVYYVIVQFGRFSFRRSMEDHFNETEPMGLSLSGVMTFFFGGLYFQYHINDIVRRKAADRMFAAAR